MSQWIEGALGVLSSCVLGFLCLGWVEGGVMDTRRGSVSAVKGGFVYLFSWAYEIASIRWLSCSVML